MAVDETLMESAGEAEGSPIFRLYGFSPPTFSVGRFQKTVGVVDFASLEKQGILFVRRPSGGQAVLHHHEVTYSVAIGRHHLESFGKRTVYRLIVPVLLSGLTLLGVTGSENTGEGNNRNPDCFASTGEYEIDGSDRRKLIGSAQMVSRRAVLQHGSIPLDGTNRGIHRFLLGAAEENHSSSLFEETRRAITHTEGATAFADAATGMLSATPSVLDERETQRAEELAETRYRRMEWNVKY